MGIEVIGSSGSSGKAPVMERITSTQSWTAPDDVDFIDLILVGGGGGGFGYSNANSNSYQRSSGGGGGGVLRLSTSVIPGSTYTITIGAGGASRNVNVNTEEEWYALAGAQSSFAGPGIDTIIAGGGMGATAYQSFFQMRNVGGYSINAVYGSGGGIKNLANTAGNAGAFGGGGGGAGGPARGAHDSMTQVFQNAGSVNKKDVSDISNYWTGNAQGYAGGQASVSNNPDDTRALVVGGLGTPEGYGAGGSGSTAAIDDRYSILSQVSSSGNGGKGAIVDSNDSTPGAINTGSGGGGGGRRLGDDKDGSPGGSGIAVLKYWTAG